MADTTSEMDVVLEQEPMFTEIEFLWGRDIFKKQPGVLKQSVKNTELKLEGIIFDGRQSLAILNREVVSLGQVMQGGYRVSEIGINYIILEKKGSRKELLLEAEELIHSTPISIEEVSEEIERVPSSAINIDENVKEQRGQNE